MTALARQVLPPLGEGEVYEARGYDPDYNLNDDRERCIVLWRVDCFERAGLGLSDAMLLGLRRDVDRAQVESMLVAGATAAQLRAILL